MDTISSQQYITDDRLEDYAAAAARLFVPGRPAGGRAAAAGLRKNYRLLAGLKAEYEMSGEHDSGGKGWLLDNFYIIEREYSSVRRDFLSAPALRHWGGAALISRLSFSLLSSGQGELTVKRAELFLRGFQRERALSRCELLLFPSAVKAEIISAISAELLSDESNETKERAVGRLFSSLRLISEINTEKLLYSCDVTAKILSRDRDFSDMDMPTRQRYLDEICKLARKSGKDEQRLASELMNRAEKMGQHVGFLIFREPSPKRARAYILGNVLLTLSATALIALRLNSRTAAALLLLPVSELVKSLLDFVLSRRVSPRPLPEMDLSRGIPEKGKTVCVISALLTDTESSIKLCRRLEELYLSNGKDSRLMFGLLADLPEAQRESCREDREIISAVRADINALNRKYGGGFYFFTRARSFDGEKYSGRERKRGAIMALAALLEDKNSELEVTGERDNLTGTRYIVTLDSDTGVYPGTIKRLIGAMLHPLNRAFINREKGTVTGGHGIIQPKISTELQSACATDFALIYAGAGGCEPYGGPGGELYADAFGSGGFSGKGIIDVSALNYCLEGTIPEGRVLSHDAIEGAYLRGGFMGNTEFSDRFPSKPPAYYKRLKRWIRGDVQNLPWIFKKELPAMERWRLFDSVRRSLVAPATLLALVTDFFLPGRAVRAGAWAALFALLTRLFVSLAQSCLKSPQKKRLRRSTRILSGLGGAIVYTFIGLWLLPYEAWVSLSAAAVSLWRMLVSHKKMLQWQTSAQSMAEQGTAASYFLSMWQSVILGLMLIFLSPLIIGRAAGLMWILSPLCLWALGLPAYRTQELSAEDRRYLLRAAEMNLQYLREQCSKYDNYLPPDNFQEQPPVGTAHRSSPTNIGLALCSFAAACDMGLMSAEEAAQRAGRILDTMEKMPKFRGHFYNWYDTRSLEVMSPPYISTVDSGNLCACLICAGEAFKEMGKPELWSKTREFIKEMDFSGLYDRNKGLFYICLDTVADRGIGGWYDLMASEAMLTGYLAVAKGDVPVNHWRRLSRAQLQKDGYRGLASWTGTMFEYMMPYIFLPLFRGSLLYESARFCLYVQRHRVFAGKPWGISESGYFSLDSNMNYSYKANGCGALALRRGQDSDMVVSPYSSFLALAAEGGEAVKNLRLLELMGATGRYGFMEALDFTPERCRSSEGEKVQCFMAHHIGMSICSCANALCSNSMVRHFMNDPAMASGALLLQERIPETGEYLRRNSLKVPEKPAERFTGFWKAAGGENEVRCCPLSNGIYNILVSSSGESLGTWGKMRLYGSGKLPEKGSVRAELICGQSKIPLLPGIMKDWSFEEDMCRWQGESRGLKIRGGLWTLGGEPGELREFSFTAEKSSSFAVELSIEPVMAEIDHWENHPAFWRLGLGTELWGGWLLIRRLRRGKCPEMWLCAASDRELEFEGISPYLNGSPLKIRTNFTLNTGESASVRFVLCAGADREAVLLDAKRALTDASRGTMTGAAAVRLGMDAQEYGRTADMLIPLLSPLGNAPARRELWKFGISGDEPIICADCEGTRALTTLNRFLLLSSCGVSAELVYLSSQQGEYFSPSRRKISERLRRLGLEGLIGAGIYFVPAEEGELILKSAAFSFENERSLPERPELPRLSAPREKGSVPEYENSQQGFKFRVFDNLPGKPWQNILTNGRLSAIVTDTGPQSLWLENAREMRINEPPRDNRPLYGTELIYFSLSEENVSPFAANDGRDCEVFYAPGLARWEKEMFSRTLRATAFVPPGRDVRFIIIEGAQGLKLNWLMEIVLGAGDGSSVKCGEHEGIFSAENPESYFEGIKFKASVSGRCNIKSDIYPGTMSIVSICGERVVLCCGCCSDRELRELCDIDEAMNALSLTERRWSAFLGRFKIKSPYPQLDNYMNLWAGYQICACRLLARGSIYQSGGAFGFRDQLQDGVNILPLSESFARERISDACRHQYEEGDVMHWWHPHPQGDRGIRSRCSDDLLWLVWALCQYCKKTGDRELCSLKLPFVSSPVLKEDERERYERPEPAIRRETVLNHARMAMEQCEKRGLGPHGLPFFGSGDWNDGMDEVQGESLWLGFFYSSCAYEFSELLKELGEEDYEKYYILAEKIGTAADSCFNGSFYPRGFSPDGSPIGGSGRIDSLPQSFAAMNPFADRKKAEKAVKEALGRLVDRENKLVKLFDPPYSPEEEKIGYITSYGEGYRENGGQYTHGAVWLAAAAFELGLEAQGREIMLMLLPENHDLKIYEGEPYVLSADVSSAEGHGGEAGWTWYTGSAGWYYRVAAENMLGLKMEGGEIFRSGPCSLPFSFKWESQRPQEENRGQ